MPRPSAPRRSYHHGDLRRALIDATLALAAEGDPARVSVREAARRAGVSSGAPFRHFENRRALMTAVAEEAMGRLREHIEHAQRAARSDDPLLRFRALGPAYLRWAMRNPTHFRIISSRELIDFDGSAVLRAHNADIRALMGELLTQAQARGQLRAGLDLPQAALSARALAYGLARMHIDRQYAQWDVPDKRVEAVARAALDALVDGWLA